MRVEFRHTREYFAARFPVVTEKVWRNVWEVAVCYQALDDFQPLLAFRNRGRCGVVMAALFSVFVFKMAPTLVESEYPWARLGLQEVYYEVRDVWNYLGVKGEVFDVNAVPAVDLLFTILAMTSLVLVDSLELILWKQWDQLISLVLDCAWEIFG